MTTSKRTARRIKETNLEMEEAVRLKLSSVLQKRTLSEHAPRCASLSLIAMAGGV